MNLESIPRDQPINLDHVRRRMQAADHYTRMAQEAEDVEEQRQSDADKIDLLRSTLFGVIEAERARCSDESRIAALIEVYRRTAPP